MNANCKSAAFTSRASSKAHSNCLYFFNDAPGDFDKFHALNSRMSASIGALKKHGTEFIFKAAKAPAERRLPYI